VYPHTGFDEGGFSRPFFMAFESIYWLVIQSILFFFKNSKLNKYVISLKKTGPCLVNDLTIEVRAGVPV